ncbi:hypothetical protein [Kitasatospora aureofaciens]|uniref:hypothetical protein n=1 Tax=Kitasatospora aureofaciens TaxID=1894 RepID=UPI000527D0F0|nr:hypothetical protein [Kitasatospora aureofaciens]HJD81582.1 hypothetical protein [Kitasatospora aureofaciens]
MRTTLAAALLLGSALTPVFAASPAAAAQTAVPRAVNQGYSIPVGGITDLGALPVLGSLGLDFARLLGQ